MDFINASSKFLSIIWDFVTSFFGYLVNTGSNIREFFSFIFSVVLEIPYILVTIFNNLPDFMRTGISVVLTGISIIFILKIIKMIRDVTI